jgi:hypothetical protein
LAERIESLKAGGLSSSVTALAGLGLYWLQQGLGLTLEPWPLLVCFLLLCGFFFGVTYRYVVREDSNVHLSSGAVGAFGLVRGLTQIEADWSTLSLPTAGINLVVALVPFAVASRVLDGAIARGWIRPIPSA